MQELDKTDWEILNATADDCENLEQIYLANCFEAHSGLDGSDSIFLRPHKNAPLLSELAERIPVLITRGLLTVVMDDNGNRVTNAAVPEMVWRGWFAMTALGRQVWNDSPYSLVEQEQSS